MYQHLVLAASLVGLAFATSASAQQKLLPAQSEMGFTIKEMGVPLEGKFGKFNADLTFDVKKPEAGKINFSIDLGSAAVGDVETSKELKKPEWFNLAKFPTATFNSTAIRSLGPGKLDVAGILTIKGNTKPVNVPVTLTPSAGGVTLAQGNFTIKRIDFKIGEGDWTDVSIVANDVLVKFKLAVSGI